MADKRPGQTGPVPTPQVDHERPGMIKDSDMAIAEYVKEPCRLPVWLR